MASQPLFDAVRKSDMEEVKRLIILGADINLADKLKRTPIHMAAWLGNYNMIQYLIRSKANLQAKANDNFTPLHFVSQSNNPEAPQCIELILKKDKTLLNLRVSKGSKTALHLAVIKGLEENIKTLIQLGSDVEAKTSTGQNAIDLAKTVELKNLIISMAENKIKNRNSTKDGEDRKKKTSKKSSKNAGDEIQQEDVKDDDELADESGADEVSESDNDDVKIEKKRKREKLSNEAKDNNDNKKVKDE